MEPADQASLTKEFMFAVSPVVTRRLLRELYRSGPFHNEEAMLEMRRHLADKNAALILEFASHMAARFAQLEDATKLSPKKDATAAKQPVAKNPTS